MMNVSQIEPKIIEFIKRPEQIEHINKVNKKNETLEIENLPKQKKQEQNSSNNEVRQEPTLMNMVKEVLEELKYNNPDINVGFKIIDDFKEPIIEIIDKDSNEVIKQIPSEEFIERMKNLEELKGMLFDDKF
jgi:flagellar protein FlaG